MDADDIAVRERLAKQVAFLDAHPRVGIVGSACREIDAAGRPQAVRPVPLGDLEIRWASLLASPFLHPTVMMRRAVLTTHDLNYDVAFEAAQDYDLWTRMLRYTQGANLSEPLVHYRLDGGMTRTRRSLQLKNHDLIAHRTIREQLPECPVSLTRVRGMRALLVGGDGPLQPEDEPDVLLHTYLNLFAAFAARHTQEPDLSALKGSEAVRVARRTGEVQGIWRKAAVLGRLLKLHPPLPLVIMRRRLARASQDLLRLLTLSGLQSRIAL
jgi:hypothetical protein